MLELFVTSLIVCRQVAQIDLLSACAEHSQRVLSAQYLALIRGICCHSFHSGFVVYEIIIIYNDLFHDVFISGHLQDDILNQRSVVGSGSTADPSTAPEKALRSFSSAPATLICDRSIGISCHGEVDQPSGSKVAEYFAIGIEAFAPVIRPQVEGTGFLSVNHLLGVINPLHQVVIDYDLAILYPFAGYVVGVYTISIVYGRYHVVTGCFHLLSGCGEGIPIRYRLLNLCRIIGSQNSLSSLTVVNQNAGAALP